MTETGYVVVAVTCPATFVRAASGALPLVSPPSDDCGGFFEHVLVYLLRHADRSLHHWPSTYVAFRIGLLVPVFAVRLVDGAPIVVECWW